MIGRLRHSYGKHQPAQSQRLCLTDRERDSPTRHNEGITMIAIENHLWMI